MNELICGLGELFTASFEILPVLGNLPNLVLGLIGAGALFFSGKVSVAEKNICE
ncbi:hypothetical protein N9V23_02320 [Flavobacteriales bacterium]|jgi:hypothetical protein|nr:hypothetical protein [Flavobacteriales bacterium]MDB2317571.1 hypothetical protein [Flavobacteriales bacterium]MDB2622381.1 hypothetical protein [Flavobacteriales bacterium]